MIACVKRFLVSSIVLLSLAAAAVSLTAPGAPAPWQLAAATKKAAKAPAGKKPAGKAPSAKAPAAKTPPPAPPTLRATQQLGLQIEFSAEDVVVAVPQVDFVLPGSAPATVKVTLALTRPSGELIVEQLPLLQRNIQLAYLDGTGATRAITADGSSSTGLLVFNGVPSEQLRRGAVALVVAWEEPTGEPAGDRVADGYAVRIRPAAARTP